MIDTFNDIAKKRADTLPVSPDGVVEFGTGHNGGPPLNDPEFWYQLIDEREAAAFLGLTARTLQSWRQRGGGPKFIRISSRCIKYQRIILKSYAEDRLRASTSDDGRAAA